jgi:hypothetical protein
MPTETTDLVALRQIATQMVRGMPTSAELVNSAADEIEMWRERDAQHKKIAAALETMKEMHHGN